MTNLVPGGANLPSSFQSRSLDRAVLRGRAQTALQIAAIENAADVQVARVQAVGYVGSQALHTVALVSQLEGQLTQLVPLAASRLQPIGDMTALAVAEVVADTVRKVGR
jgi:hypothetical protein